MEAPRNFTEKLDKEFNGRLRVRWSNQRNEWQIEEKVARSQGMRLPADEYHDEATRLRDGYTFICAIRPGDRMPCPKCQNTLKVPIHHFAEVKCDYCQVRGRTSAVVAAHFPLGDMLLEHLRKLDPLRGWRDGEKYGNYDEFLEKRANRQIENLSGIWADNHRKLVGIPQVGYTGKEKY